jgi:lactate/malate dehydrogenase, NAD binding domain
MFSSATAKAAAATATSAARAMSTAAGKKKVAVLGASGGIGQPLSLLLKLSPEVGELACYDVVGTPGVAADLSHVRAAQPCSAERTSLSSFGDTQPPCFVSSLATRLLHLCYLRSDDRSPPSPR